MTKADLVEAIIEKTKITRVKAELIVITIFESMSTALKNQERIEIRGFGSFETRHYDAYKGRNPRTGEIIEVKEKKMAFFRVGKNLKRQVDRKTKIS